MDAALPVFENRMNARRLASFAAIVLLHLGFFYALNNGLMQHVSAIVPKVIYAVMLPQEKAAEPQPALPLPTPKKIVPLVENVPVPPPVIDIAPAPTTVTQNFSPAATTPPSPAAAPAAAAPAQPAAPKIVSGVEYIQQPQPVYPVQSRRRNEEGVVQLRVLINEAGRATQIDIVKSSDFPRLDEAARVAVQNAVFKPYMENGRALAVFAIVPINFRLG